MFDTVERNIVNLPLRVDERIFVTKDVDGEPCTAVVARNTEVGFVVDQHLEGPLYKGEGGVVMVIPGDHKKVLESAAAQEGVELEPASDKDVKRIKKVLPKEVAKHAAPIAAFLRHQATVRRKRRYGFKHAFKCGKSLYNSMMNWLNGKRMWTFMRVIFGLLFLWEGFDIFKRGTRMLMGTEDEQLRVHNVVGILFSILGMLNYYKGAEGSKRALYKEKCGQATLVCGAVMFFYLSLVTKVFRSYNFVEDAVIEMSKNDEERTKALKQAEKARISKIIALAPLFVATYVMYF